MIDNLAKQAYNLDVVPRAQVFIGRITIQMRSYFGRFLALLCALTLLTAPARAASSHDALQRQIDAFCQECGVVGLSAAYVGGGTVKDTFAWGWATYPHDPMTADTSVRIASISKILVGIAAHLSAQAGKLDLDGPIDYALGYYLAHRSTEDVITPRSILTHTSSIVPNPAATGVFDGVIELLSNPDSFYAAVSGNLKDWDYNNFAFYVLGLAIEKANGQTMDEILNPALCDPLGIDGSFWAGDLKDQSHVATQYDKDHCAVLTVPMQTEIHNPGVAANGSVFAGNYHISARDLGKIVATLAADGCYEGRQILDPAIVEALMNPQTVIEDTTPANWKTANNGLKLTDMQGVSYDDPKWDLLLDQISKEEMTGLISTGGWQTAAVKSVGKARYLECDGPNGINNLMGSFFAGIKGNMYTNQATLAQTWNPELAYEKGLVYGREAKVYGVAGIYGPAANIHRSPFSGRNYEYYSEDGYLSGVMAERELTGIKESGVYCYFKHFAVNDQETNRDHGGLVTWLNEQALREVYLRGFEVAVKGGSATGIMSSFNRIGTTPTAESPALLNTVLRDEWGFRGAVITDCVMACTTEEINRATLAGNDFQLSFGILSNLSDELKNSASGQAAMRQATKNILYMIAGSDAPQLYKAHMTTVGKILLIVFLVLMLLFIQYYVRYFIRLRKWKKGQMLT